ncbi:MAG TPA: hypothetical protein DCE43_17220, partial [Planctomycetaceae bacterium]|nr:hypothetical protein [Planctomycetaceae bacterium]
MGGSIIVGEHTVILKQAGRAVQCLDCESRILRPSWNTTMIPRLFTHLLPAAGFLVAALTTVGPTSIQAQDTATQFQFPASRTAWI